jgi:hypothetical protein
MRLNRSASTCNAGSRLPKAIIKKLTERLLDPEEFLTDFGIASENLKSDKLMMRSFTRGPVVAPAQMLLISGLYEGGEKEAAVSWLPDI